MIVAHTSDAGTRLAADPSWDVEQYDAFRRLVADFEPAPLAGHADVVTVATRLARTVSHHDTQNAVELVHGHVALATAEGRTFRLGVSPGTITLRAFDATRLERRTERERTDPTADMLALYIDPETGESTLPDGAVPGSIHAWSSKSRARMFQTIPSLDFAAWDPASGDLAMVTLTLPGEWEHLAPTGKAFKRLTTAFQNRWRRAGLLMVGLWKLEFQRRGAPHLHMLLRVPAMVAGDRFETWLSRIWSEVVGADDTSCHGMQDGRRVHLDGDPGCDCERPDTERQRHRDAGTGVDYSGREFRDPRRIATYFLGHSSKHVDGKEYQHRVPELWQEPGAGPGRFWGYWGLERAHVEIDLDQHEWVQVRRVMRHVARARAWRQAQDAARYGKTIRRRSLRSLGAGGSLTGGTVVLNDAVAFAYDLVRCVEVWRL